MKGLGIDSTVASFFVTALDVLTNPVLATRLYALSLAGYNLGHDFLNFDFSQVTHLRRAVLDTHLYIPRRWI